MPESPCDIVHLTTVHPRYDIRIFLKECAALRQAGFRVHMVVADGKGEETRDGILVHDVGTASNRFHRMLSLPFRAWRKLRQLKPTIVHFHDPELLPLAVLLMSTGTKVIYDAHEDLPRSVLSKQWIMPSLRRPLSRVVEIVENVCARRLAAIVTATPHITRRFTSVSEKVVGVYNYPNLPNIPQADGITNFTSTFCYVGAITRHRCIFEMVKAAAIADARLLLAGRFEDARLEAQVKAMSEWKNVEFLGTVSHADVWALMRRSAAGLLFFYPEPNHVNALPNKMFEYMAAGLPVLCSNFPGWREIVESEVAGFVCNPLDPIAIASLMRQVAADPKSGRQMGEQGRRAVQERYHWPSEASKLIELYHELTLNDEPGPVRAVRKA